MPSDAYRRSVAEQAGHHGRSKTFSGSLLEPHLGRLAGLLDDCETRTVLDYGCGKAKLWDRPEDGSATLQKRLGIRGLTLYDPCVQEFSSEEGLGEDNRYDVVILSHVLFWIPVADLHKWVLPMIYRLARRHVLVVETIGDPKKRILSQPDLHPRGLHAIDWIDLLLPHQLEGAGATTLLVTEYRALTGRIYAGEWRL